MPSSHAQFAFFFAVSLSLFLLVRHGQDGNENILSVIPSITHLRPSATKIKPNISLHSASDSNLSSSSKPIPSYPIPSPTRLLTSLASLLTASLVAASRVYLSYHTPQQVAVGAAAGTICGLAWFRFTDGIRRSGFLVNWLLETPVAKFFRIRDLVVRDNLVEAEWGRWRDLVALERESLRKRERENEQSQGKGQKDG